MRCKSIVSDDRRLCSREDSFLACGEISSNLQVTCLRAGGFLVPVRFGRSGVMHEVTRVVDRWPGADHQYVKVETRSGDAYILRYDGRTGSWEVTLFREAAP